jgi:hypothetical protein
MRLRCMDTEINGLGLEYLEQWLGMHGLGHGLLYFARAIGAEIDGETSRRIRSAYLPRFLGRD